MAQQEIEVILLRQLASHLATPIIVVDPKGDLLYFNEPAEAILGRRFDETQDIKRAEFAAIFQSSDEHGVPLRPDEQLLAVAADGAAPAHRRFWIRGMDGVRRHIEGAAFPLIGQNHRLLGAFALFWEVREFVKVRLWGTRGSVATPGPETMRYGGNTACVEVRNDDGTLLVLDAGTGVRRLGATVEAGIQRVDLLLTHLHMDHIQGLGFFEPLFRPGLEVHIWGPSTTTLDLRAHLNRYLSPPLFPVRLRELPCRLTLHDAVATPRFEIDGVSVEAMLVAHPGATVGFRIEADGASVAYIPDHEPALGTGRVPDHPAWISGLALARDVDLLIHDAQYTAAEYPDHVGWGHSSIPQALTFTRAAGARKLIAFHHDPAHSDAMLDRVYEEVRSQDLPFEVQCASEGDVFKLGRAAKR